MFAVEAVITQYQVVIRGEKGIPGGETVLTVELSFVAFTEEKIAVRKAPFLLGTTVLVTEEDLTLALISLRIFGRKCDVPHRFPALFTGCPDLPSFP